jgi:pimeloyl-ACP methyl ester carboxylesterase
MPSVPIGDRVIAYDESGSGEPIVWLQGTGESKQGFIAQTSELSERYRCIALDHRDVGESSYVDEPYSPADLAADAAVVMDALEIGSARVVGFSLGGAAAQELALARPDLVRALVLLSTWATSDGWFKAQMRNWQSIRRQHWEDEEGFLDALGPWLWSPATYATPGLVEGLNTVMRWKSRASGRRGGSASATQTSHTTPPGGSAASRLRRSSSWGRTTCARLRATRASCAG